MSEQRETTQLTTFASGNVEVGQWIDVILEPWYRRLWTWFQPAVRLAHAPDLRKPAPSFTRGAPGASPWRHGRGDMGLDVSHEAWHGAYSAFNRLRQKVCEAMGGSFPPHEDRTLDLGKWYWGEGYSAETHPGLMEFLAHSDCDGEIGPAMCQKVADELEALLPKIAALDDGDAQGGVSFTRTDDGSLAVGRHPGHIARAGGYAAAVQKFINGCRLAAERGEPLQFG